MTAEYGMCEARNPHGYGARCIGLLDHPSDHHDVHGHRWPLEETKDESDPMLAQEGFSEYVSQLSGFRSQLMNDGWTPASCETAVLQYLANMNNLNHIRLSSLSRNEVRAFFHLAPIPEGTA